MGGFPFSPTTFKIYAGDFASIISAIQDGVSMVTNGESSLQSVLSGLLVIPVVVGVFYAVYRVFGKILNENLSKKGDYFFSKLAFFLTSLSLLSIFLLKFSSDEPFEVHWFKSVSFRHVSSELVTQNGKILREFFPLPNDRFYLDEDFPLVHGNLIDYCKLFNDTSTCSSSQLSNLEKIIESESEMDRPDIFLISWESLNGNYVSMVDNPMVANTTKYLHEYFKTNGVFYHEYVASGSPTVQSLWSTVNQGLSLHRANFLQTVDFAFDSIFAVIKRSFRNYYIGFVGSSNPPYDRQNAVLDLNHNFIDDKRGYFKYENHGTYKEDFYQGVDKNRFPRWNNDRILIDQVINRLTLVDSLKLDRPLFYYLLSISTHLDLSTFDSPSPSETEFPVSWVDRYVRALKYSDEHLIKRFIDFLKTRDRFNNTVVVVVGDHGCFNKNLGPQCVDCPPKPFDNDQVFYTTATLLYFGSDEQRKKLRIPPPGTVDYRAVSNLDIAATITDLAGSRHTPTSALGRSLLDPGVHDDSRKTFSMTQGFAEMGLKDIIVRTNWGKTRRYFMPRPHPTYTDSSTVFIDTEYAEKMVKIADSWHYLVFSNRIWSRKFIGEKVSNFKLKFALPYGYALWISFLIGLSVIDISIRTLLQSRLCRKSRTIVPKSSLLFDVDLMDFKIGEISNTKFQEVEDRKLV
ncbi:hypothetical protein RCL1_002945 [Eukaryota sp. TZLM3-RCL]